MQKMAKGSAGLVLLKAAICASVAAAAMPATARSGATLDEARMISPYGERAAFSPDGTRVAFVGKSFGDAYEVNLKTGETRNITAHVAHQGVLRVQYLPNGDFLVFSPRRYKGSLSRLRLNLYVLDKNLKGGLKALNEEAFEGIALSKNGMIAWQAVPPGQYEVEKWADPELNIQLEHFIGRLDYSGGTVRIVDKRKILERKPEGCRLEEVQDFRRDGQEVVYYCMGKNPATGKVSLGIFGYDVKSGDSVVYRSLQNPAGEVEGIAPDGTWAAVECSDGEVPSHQRDICRLELVPNGNLKRLMQGGPDGTTRKVNNPVVSPDGRWIAFQSADKDLDPGEGTGIYIYRLPDL